jgi:6-phosphogluconate dehydrogenase
MKIAVAGLGRMGMQIAHSLVRDGHEVFAQNRSPEKVDQAVSFGAKAAYKPTDVAEAFGSEQAIVWLMVPAEVVDEELDAWLAVLKKGDIIVDGGNSDFRNDKTHYDKVVAAGLELVDAGTSGGVHGFANGFSIMVGGAEAAVAVVAPALDSLVKPRGAWHHFEGAGSGHYVKMVHNAIEYGMMESLAEGYRMLREGAYPDLDLVAAGEVWQHGSVVESWLNDLTRQALKENPKLDGISGLVAESGEAKWTLEIAKEKGIPMQSIQAAFDVRLASQQGQTNFATKLLAAMRNKFGGHNLNGAGAEPPASPAPPTDVAHG